MKQIKALKEIQELEKKEAEFNRRLKNLPQTIRLREMKREIEDEQRELLIGKDKLEQLGNNIKNLESNLEKERLDLSEISSKLYSGEITNLKELESNDSRQTSLKTQMVNLEDEILRLLEEREEFKKSLKEKNNGLREKKLEFKKLLEDYHSEQDAIKIQLSQIPGRKEALFPKIDLMLLKEYNDKKEKYANSVVVETHKQICQGCNMAVSFDTLKKLKLKEEIVYCDKCGRLLIYN